MTDDDLDDAAAPNCERCLASMEVAGLDESPVWRCSLCGLVRLA